MSDDRYADHDAAMMKDHDREVEEAIDIDQDDRNEGRMEQEELNPNYFACDPCECGGHPDCPDCNPEVRKEKHSIDVTIWARENG